MLPLTKKYLDEKMLIIFPELINFDKNYARLCTFLLELLPIKDYDSTELFLSSE